MRSKMVSVCILTRVVNKIRMIRWCKWQITAVIACLWLQGCGAVVVSGAMVGVSMVHDRRTTETVVEDEKIELRAAARLGEDKALNQGSQVSFTSYNRTVLITGQVDSDTAKARIVELVQKIPGVKRVIDEITTETPATFQQLSNDAYITSKVKLALFSIKIPGFDPTRVEIVTEQEVVYLMGLVTTNEAAEVVNTARYIHGVKRVVSLFEYIRPDS